MKTIGSVAIEIMRRENLDHIDIGKYGLLDDIFDECKKLKIIKKAVNHPMDRQMYVMANLRNSKLFVRDGYLDYPGYGRGYVKCRVMKIRCVENKKRGE